MLLDRWHVVDVFHCGVILFKGVLSNVLFENYKYN